jgi:glutamine synthetase
MNNESLREGAVGRSGFIAAHDLWNDDQKTQAKEVVARVKADKLDFVRLAFADQHGILRGKTLAAVEIESVVRNGCAIPVTLLGKDTANRTLYPVFSPDGGFGVPEMGGAGDMIMLPLPHTFKELPWAPNTGWMLCDILLKNGKPVPFSTRHLYAEALRRLATAGFDYVAGLEVEFYVLKLELDRIRPEDATQPPPPLPVSPLAYGYHYLTETRFDQLDAVVQLLAPPLAALGLPIRTFEGEFGPSQLEVTFAPTPGMEAADNMMLFRSAVKQICRRNGLHATFMCRPGIPNMFASGWHLHQSLRDRASGKNAFAPKDDAEPISAVGQNYVAGVLKHARASCVFSTPTINGYKRYKPNSLAPDRAIWGRDHKGAMLRVVTGGAGDPGTRIENRVGEPAANPYLYMGSQVISGLDGIDTKLMPATVSDTPYEAQAEKLPLSLMEALDAFRGSDLYRQKLGQQFVEYFLKIKDAEVARFLSEVTDWEHREYFEMF